MEECGDEDHGVGIRGDRVRWGYPAGSAFMDCYIIWVLLLLKPMEKLTVHE